MTPFEKIQAYSKAVCAQMRWKKAHPIITEEIENHLIDQRNAYMADGADEAAATDKAITQMGDPVTVGAQLDRTHRPKPQWGLMAIAIVFLVSGITFQFIMQWGSGYRWMVNLFIAEIIGLAIFSGLCFSNFTWIGRYSKIIVSFLVVLFCLGFVFVRPNILSANANAVLLVFPVGFAGIVYSLRNKGYRGIILSICTLSVLMIIPILAQARWLRSECILVVLSSLAVLCVAIAKRWFGVKPIKGLIVVAIPATVALILLTVFIISDSSRLEWFLGAFNSSYKTLNPETAGWQLKAMLSGSKFIGHGTMPDGTNNGSGYGIWTILTSLIYQFGWISVIPIISLFIIFIVISLRLCPRQKSTLALYLSISATMVLSLEFIGYVIFNLGFYVLPSISLPLICQPGNYVFYANMALIGMMLSVFRTGHVIKDNNLLAAHRLIPFQNGKLIFSK